MAETQKVANPPAGGDPTFASTNDDNQNTILKTQPYTVTIAANGQMGVVSRFNSQADAEADAAARRELVPGATFEVKKEAELPAYLAEVEGTAAPVDEAPKSATKGK